MDKDQAKFIFVAAIMGFLFYKGDFSAKECGTL